MNQSCNTVRRNAGLSCPQTCAQCGQCGLGLCTEPLAALPRPYHFPPTPNHYVDEAQLVTDFRALDAYGRRCALAMLAGLARLGATS